MTYQVLARKWRPQDFANVVGQKPIVTTLQNAILEGRIAQAYLFSGIRGVGKTSVARVLAKALNCEKGPAADPCNECTSCREIAAGSDLLDVIEVDAATYSKVEQVRELTESLRYGPARSRYKVVIIDEIHRLSRQAFDALLKIVEEPPKHLVFIFATTEIDAVPATILSRCQEFHFRRVPASELVTLLRSICKAEGISVSDNALRLIARAGEGSVRDSVALLDQLATFGSGSVDDEEAARVLGGVDLALFAQLLSAILAGDHADVLSVVAAVEEEGWDPRRVYAEFLTYCRDGLHLALGAEPAQVDLPAESAAELQKACRQAGFENMLRLLSQLLSSEEAVRRSETGSLAVEIAWLRGAELPRLTRIEEILSGGAVGGGSEPVADTGDGAVRAGPTVTKRPGSTASTAPSAFVPPAPAADPAGRELPPVPERKGEADHEDHPPAPFMRDENIRRFVEHVAKSKQMLAAHLEEAQDMLFEDGVLRILSPRGDGHLESAVMRSANRKVLNTAVSLVWGEDSRWHLREADGPPHPPPPTPDDPDEDRDEMLDHPLVQTVLEVFGGEVAGASGATTSERIEE